MQTTLELGMQQRDDRGSCDRRQHFEEAAEAFTPAKLRYCPYSPDSSCKTSRCIEYCLHSLLVKSRRSHAT